MTEKNRDTIVVERTFPEPVEFDDIQALENAFGWCLETYDVKFLRTFFSGDGKRMICLYSAPDAESVRRVNDTAKLPYDSIWTATKHGDGAV